MKAFSVLLLLCISTYARADLTTTQVLACQGQVSSLKLELVKPSEDSRLPTLAVIYLRAKNQPSTIKLTSVVDQRINRDMNLIPSLFSTHGIRFSDYSLKLLDGHAAYSMGRINDDLKCELSAEAANSYKELGGTL